MTAPTGDDALLGMLRQTIAERDPVPEAVIAAARAAFSMAALDAELATLTYDSSFNDEDTRALVRSRGGSRQLTFEGPNLTIELEVASGERRLLGQLVPAGPAIVEVRSPESSRRVEADHLGRFAAGGVPAGPVSLRCHGESRPVTETEWVVL